MCGTLAVIAEGVKVSYEYVKEYAVYYVIYIVHVIYIYTVFMLGSLL